MLDALAPFGAPTSDVTPSDFTKPDVFFQMGVEPDRMDIMTSVKSLEFAGAWNSKVLVDFGGEVAPVLCRENVLRRKKHQARPVIAWMHGIWSDGSEPIDSSPARG